MKFKIVLFIQDEMTAIVPKSWVHYINGNTYGQWPKFYKAAAVKQCKSPDKNWDKFPVRILGEAGM